MTITTVVTGLLAIIASALVVIALVLLNWRLKDKDRDKKEE